MRFVALLATCIVGLSHAQVFKPYPTAHVTGAQWQAYLDEVKAKHGATMREPPGLRIIFQDEPNASTYVFTQPGNNAHPAWTTRKLEMREGGIYLGRIGYFAGDEASFAKWYREYVALDEQFKAHMAEKNRGKR